MHGRIVAKRSKKPPPPLTRWHEPEAWLYPGLSTHPFHEPADAWWCARVAEASALLERFYPVIREEALALGRSQQPLM